MAGSASEKPPEVFEWQVLPFGTACSPCCAVYALQCHTRDYSEPDEDVRIVVENNFYVDNCLYSLSNVEDAKMFVNKLQTLLTSGGFELRQWAANHPEVIAHLPTEAKTGSNELWLAQNQLEQQELTLGLRWHCQQDELGYRHRAALSTKTTMRHIYRVLAKQYDPLGFITPSLIRAKIIVQQLWDKQRDWDDPHLPADLLHAWFTWEQELTYLPQITFPCCYISPAMDTSDNKQEVHIFCDASEQAYGSIAYLRTENATGEVDTAFITARSRVAPKRRHSIPRLELCAAVTGAQLAKLLEKELTINIHAVTFWTDSTTVLNWIQSDSCRFKVFVGTRIAEIQDLTNTKAWRYVESERNPADNITRGKPLQSLIGRTSWSEGPPFLSLPPENWPLLPELLDNNTEEIRNTNFCGLISHKVDSVPEAEESNTYQELIEHTAASLHGAADLPGKLTADDYKAAELTVL